jgi:transposase-like protein
MKQDLDNKLIKEKDVEWIKAFSNISVARVCRELGINKNNLYTFKISAENTSKVKKEIEKRLREIL